MSILNAFLKQKITYWAKASVDGFNDETFSVPVSINARWEDRSTLVLNEAGQEVLSSSRIYLDQDVNVGDYLYNGTSVVTDPRTLNGADKIINFRKVPDLTANSFERRVFL